jgi:hypothetical protein
VPGPERSRAAGESLRRVGDEPKAAWRPRRGRRCAVGGPQRRAGARWPLVRGRARPGHLADVRPPALHASRTPRDDARPRPCRLRLWTSRRRDLQSPTCVRASWPRAHGPVRGAQRTSIGGPPWLNHSLIVRGAPHRSANGGYGALRTCDRCGGTVELRGLIGPGGWRPRSHARLRCRRTARARPGSSPGTPCRRYDERDEARPSLAPEAASTG